MKFTHINREISWLSFNERVLQEAEDNRNPLIERMRFLGIFSNNLDEFFRVRVASLRRVAALKKRPETDPVDDPDTVLDQIHDIVLRQQDKFEEAYEALESDMATAGIHILDQTELSPEQEDFVTEYFRSQVRPRLVPIMLSGRAKFPQLKDSVIYFAVRLEDHAGKVHYGLMEIPDSLPRFLELPAPEGQHHVMFVDDVIRFRLKRLFALFNTAQAEAYTLKITRDAELDIDDDISKSLVEKMSKSIARRKKGEYVRFVYDETIPERFLNFLMIQTGMEAGEMIPGGRYHNKRDLMNFPDFGSKELCFPPQPPVPHPDLKGKTSIIREIKKRDVLLNYPYQTFEHVVDLLREAAIDPKVRRIRINLYRVAKDSSVMNALINAAKNGKKVTVVIELQARFDERNNIKWSNNLQDNGIKVIFGVSGLKVHSKLILISLRDKKSAYRVAHVGTGNFHEKTARIYSDTSLLTCDRRITNEVKKVFDFFESNYLRPTYRHLVVSPYGTRRKFTALINAEIRAAKAGEKSWITLKLNNLVDLGMIRKLYEASCAGVRVRLIVRGVCSLVPGVAGQSENITVISIVGRYLEHSRIFVFCNGGDPLYYLSSADWMTRNIDHRIEVTAPVYDLRVQSELTEYLNAQFKDNVKARHVDEKLRNRYVKGKPGQTFNSQVEVYNLYADKLKRSP